MKANLFIILARNAPLAVIFRRGPSRQVLLVKWDLRTDSFEIGQWFKGRIYERRCDLSPSGEKLIYFAAKYGNKIGPDTWSAISKPPYLTALAMWPKGDAWGGGGLFENEQTIMLNHSGKERSLADGFSLPKNFKVKPLWEHAGRGEDGPIYDKGKYRDGWRFRQEGKHGGYQSSTKEPLLRFTEAAISEKLLERKKAKYFLQCQIHAIGERQGDWYVIDHEILNERRDSLLKLPRTSWADWDSNGDLLYAKGGRLFRLSWKEDRDLYSKPPKELIDLTEQKFKPVVAPIKAQKW